MYDARTPAHLSLFLFLEAAWRLVCYPDYRAVHRNPLTLCSDAGHHITLQPPSPSVITHNCSSFMPTRTSSSEHKTQAVAGEKQPRAPPSADIFDCSTPQELFKAVTEEYSNGASAIEQERARIAALLLASSVDGGSSGAAAAAGVSSMSQDVSAKVAQKENLIRLEEMSRAIQKLLVQMQHPIVLATELRVSGQRCLSATRALESLTRPPPSI